MKMEAALHPRTIEPVAVDRKAQALFAVDAELMSPPRYRGELNPGEVAPKVLFHPNPPDQRLCFFAVCSIDNLVGPIGDIRS